MGGIEGALYGLDDETEMSGLDASLFLICLVGIGVGFHCLQYLPVV
jgi:hypothetical protein